jgi:20S proteasome alpha/beta subunit
MTICIAAVCKDRNGNDSRAVVIGSDRMVTLGNFLEFEHEIPKVTFIQPKIAVLIAGDALRGSKITNLVTQQQNVSGVSVEQTAGAIAAAYSICRDAQIENDFFRSRGITKSGFYAGQFLGISQHQGQLFFSIDNAVQTFIFNVELLVAGLDERGAHIFYIGNPGGMFTDFYQIGFNAIGSGGIHAVQHLIGSNQSRLKSLNETLLSVFVAKRRAESAPGVGNETDLWIIDDEKVTHLDESQLEKLEKLAREYFGDYQPEVIERVGEIYERDSDHPPAPTVQSDI